MKPLLTLLAPVLLAACQSPACPVTGPSDTVAHQVQTTQAQQQLLALSGAINTPAFTLPGPLIANSQRLTVDWDGDAIELLSQLAHQRGLSFAYTGVRLPLPVTVHVQSMTFDEVLRLIGTQINWRAHLDQEPLRLRLDFMLPLQEGVMA